MTWTFLITTVLRKNRPPEYLDELRACATAHDNLTITLDPESECFRELQKKYADAPREGKPRVDCTHRGEQIAEQRCEACGGHVMLKVFACEVHARCCIGKTAGGVKSCSRCAEYSPAVKK